MAEQILPPTRIIFKALLTSGLRSYLLIGENDKNRLLAAKEIAQSLNCPRGGTDNCSICQSINHEVSPDFLVVRPEESKHTIGVEQVRSLLTSLNVRPYRTGSQRVIAIEPAEAMQVAAQNALLKALEEPSDDTWFLLLAKSENTLLATVNSRVGVFRLEASEKVEEGGAGGSEPTATSLRSGSLFMRLTQAKAWSEDSYHLSAAVSQLQANIILDVKAGNITVEASYNALQAIDSFRHALAANVTPRVALERLLVQLA